MIAALRSLKSRNYRLFFAGQLVSLVGTWLTNVATSWLAYRLTGSAFLLGLVGFIGQIPAFFLSPVAGVFVDRWPLRRVLVITQVLALLQSAALAVLTLTNRITIPWILGLAAFQGMINAFDIPTRQAFVVQMVDRREDLPNAIALNSSIFNVARLLGPPAAGILIAMVGEGWCYTVDAISYIAVIIALLLMNVPHPEHKVAAKKIWHDLREGIGYTFGFKPIRILISLIALIGFSSMPYTVLMPIFAKEILHGDATTQGFLVSAVGLGAVVGAVLLAARKNILGIGRVLVIALGLLGVSLIAFSYSRTLLLSLPVLVIIGYAQITFTASGNTLLQTIADDDKRGRVMSFFTMSFMGSMPLGSLMAGILASHFGAPTAVAIGGLITCLGCVAFFFELPRLRELIRPIYVSRGILPAVVEALQETAAVRDIATD
jgi:MFS family permease